MLEKLKEKKLLLIVAGIILVGAFCIARGFVWQTRQVEAGTSKGVEQVQMEQSNPYDHLLKVTTLEGKYGELDLAVNRKVCEKYGLNYETAKQSDLTHEMLDYQTAMGQKLGYGDNFLLGEGAETSLEGAWGDIYAFNGAGKVIREVCKNAGIHTETAKIKDIPDEVLMAIAKKCYQTSDHPK